jgi:uncharacterized protein
VRWTWDPKKNLTNRRKHGVSFETAVLVFRDPLVLSNPDPSSNEERWHTIGLIGTVTVLVVHTEPLPDPSTGEKVGRIISARKATKRERTAYEESQF